MHVFQLSRAAKPTKFCQDNWLYACSETSLEANDVVEAVAQERASIEVGTESVGVEEVAEGPPNEHTLVGIVVGVDAVLPVVGVIHVGFDLSSKGPVRPSNVLVAGVAVFYDNEPEPPDHVFGAVLDQACVVVNNGLVKLSDGATTV